MAAFGEHFLGFGDRLRRIEVFRTGVGAVHDRVTAIQAEWILELIEALAARLGVAIAFDDLGYEAEFAIVAEDD